VTVTHFKIRFLTIILGVWGIVVAAALYKYLFRDGPLPDPVLLGIPTGAWLVVFPPLPRPREEANAEA